MFKCCRRILKIRWPYVISNDEILKRTKLRRISEEVKIRWSIGSEKGLVVSIVLFPPTSLKDRAIKALELCSCGKKKEEVKIRRWKWIGHVLRMEDNSDCVTALTWKPEGRRKVGRPRTTRRRTVEKERNELGWKSWNEAKRVARNRGSWKESTATLWATGPEEDRWGEVRW